MSASLAPALDCENRTAEPAQFFDSGAVENLIADYQRTGSGLTLGEIIRACQPMAHCQIRSQRAAYYEDEGELLSVIHHKLMRSLPEYDPERGSAFTFIYKLSANMLRTRVTRSRKLGSRYERLSEMLIASTPDNSNFSSQIAVNDLCQQIRLIKSYKTDGNPILALFLFILDVLRSLMS